MNDKSTVPERKKNKKAVLGKRKTRRDISLTAIFSMTVSVSGILVRRLKSARYAGGDLHRETIGDLLQVNGQLTQLRAGLRSLIRALRHFIGGIVNGHNAAIELIGH